MSCYSCIYHSRDKREHHVTCNNPNEFVSRELHFYGVNYPWWFFPMFLGVHKIDCKNYIAEKKQL